MRHDQITFEMRRGNAPISLFGHNTADSSIFKLDAPIDKNATVRLPYPNSTTVDEDTFPVVPGYVISGANGMEGAFLGVALNATGKPSGTNSQCEAAVCGLVSALCRGTISVGDWLKPEETHGHGHFAAANAWSLTNMSGGRCALAYGTCSGGEKVIDVLLLPWRICYEV